MQHLKLIDEPIGREAVTLQSKMKIKLQKKIGVLN